MVDSGEKERRCVVIAQGVWVSLKGDENVLKLGRKGSCKHCKYVKCHWTM